MERGRANKSSNGKGAVRQDSAESDDRPRKSRQKAVQKCNTSQTPPRKSAKPASSATSKSTQKVASSQNGDGGIALSVSACVDRMVSDMIKGDFKVIGENHGRPVYQKMDAKVTVFIYFWDDRDGEESSGWWFGHKVGGDQVWAYADTQTERPPQKGWQVPHDGDVDKKLRITLISSGREASKKETPAEAPRKRADPDTKQSTKTQAVRTRHDIENDPRIHAEGAAEADIRRREEEARRRANKRRREEEEEEVERKRLEEEVRRLEERQRESKRRREEEARKEAAERKRAEEEAARKKRQREEEEAAEARRLEEKRRKKREEAKKREEEEARRRREEEEAEARKRAEEARRRRKEEDERRKREEEEEARRKAEAKRRREEEAIREKEEHAYDIVRSAMKKLRTANPGTVQGLKEDVEAILEKHLDACGSLGGKITKEVQRSVKDAEERCAEIVEQRRKEAEEQKRLEEKAKQDEERMTKFIEFLKEVKNDIDDLEDKADAVSKDAAAVPKEAETTPSELQAISARVLRVADEAQEVSTNTLKDLDEEYSAMSDVGASRSSTMKGDVRDMQDRLTSAQKTLAKVMETLEAVHDKAYRTARATKKKAKREAAFQAANKSGGGTLSSEDVVAFAQSEYQYELPKEALEAIMKTLAPVTIKKFQLMRGKVAIAKSEAEARVKRAEEAVRKAEEAEERKREQADVPKAIMKRHRDDSPTLSDSGDEYNPFKRNDEYNPFSKAGVTVRGRGRVKWDAAKNSSKLARDSALASDAIRTES